MPPDSIRNVAIIAHVDHGKTTLVDRMLYQSGMFRKAELDKLVGGVLGLIMDSNPIERERGITIFSKNCAVNYAALDGRSYKINIIDTPGHADFGGEVERVLRMADGVLLLVDAFDGPMPQTRFVLSKALEAGLKPIVVVNKVDRPDSRPHHVVTEVFDLMVSLDAHDEALDFPVIYASAREGWATAELEVKNSDLRPVFEAIVQHVPPPRAKPEGPLQLQVANIDYSDYVGRIAIGRVFGGAIRESQSVAVVARDGSVTRQKVLQVMEFEGLSRKQVEFVGAGDLCAVVGLDPVEIGDTICSPEKPVGLPAITVDEPTLTIVVRVNDSPFAGREGQYVTGRQVRERLERELHSNVALRVNFGGDEFEVSGRGMLHLGILFENMRREGYEFACGKPRVILKEDRGRTLEPVELLSVDCPAECQNAVMALLGDRRGHLERMDAKAGVSGYLHLEFTVPARGLIGLRNRMLTATQGRAIMHHTFHRYEEFRGPIPQRTAGVMVTMDTGRVTSYALDGLYDRGTFFVKNGDEVYEGQIVGEHCKEGDIPVNAVKAKHLTNIRQSTKEEAYRIRPPREITLEGALEYIQDDELVEITPKSIRMRKRLLKENERKREARRVQTVG